jgi:serine protease Do
MNVSARKGPYWLLVLVVVTLLIGGLFRARAVRLPGHSALGAEKVAVNVAKNAAPVSLADFKNGFATVLGPVLPAVVNISSSKVVKTPQENVPDFFNDPMFRQFFGNQVPQFSVPHSQREFGLGSGVIVNPNGYIVTNNHVVSGATDVEVYTQDQKKYKAKVIGTDPLTDIAVIKIDATGLPTLTLGDSSALKVGDVVFAIGQPFGIGETATMGIVSATGRGLGGTIERYEDFIQTDAAINPGNSGGALVDLRGNLIGINTAILSGGGGEGGNEGVGFAIPINMARNVMNQLLTHGKVVRGYLGVYIQDVTPELAKQFGLSQGGGVLVGDVSSDTPASRAGLRKGDIILELNGSPVESRSQLQVQIAQTPPGVPVKLKIWRDGKTEERSVTLGELPENAEKAGESETSSGALEGVQVENLTPEVAKELELSPGTRGVVVTSVDPSGPAAAAGLSRGDVIQEVNHKPVTNIEQYRQAMASAGAKPALLLVNHGGVSGYMVVEPR